MSRQNVKKLIEERKRLLEELCGLSGMLHGSWVERYSVCSRKNCRCRRGERHGPRCYLVVNENGCQRQKYIPNGLVERARAGVAAYHRAVSIIDRITSINLELIKERKYGNEQ